MDKDDLAFTIFQMEWQRSRDIDDKAKYLTTVSAILIGLILTSLTITQIPTTSLIFALFALFLFLFAIYTSALTMFGINFTLKDKSVTYVSLFEEAIGKNVMSDGSSVKGIREQYENLYHLNNKRLRLMIAVFGVFICGIVAIVIGVSSSLLSGNPNGLLIPPIVFFICFIVISYVLYLILKEIPE